MRAGSLNFSSGSVTHQANNFEIQPRAEWGDGYSLLTSNTTLSPPAPGTPKPKKPPLGPPLQPPPSTADRSPRRRARVPGEAGTGQPPGLRAPGLPRSRRPASRRPHRPGSSAQTRGPEARRSLHLSARQTRNRAPAPALRRAQAQAGPRSLRLPPRPPRDARRGSAGRPGRPSTPNPNRSAPPPGRGGTRLTFVLQVHQDQ